MAHIPTMTRGDTQPDLAVTISDTRASADFSVLVASDCRIQVERDGILIVDSPATAITIAADNKSAIVSRPWGVGETDIAGRLWVQVEVNWPGAKPQTFPDDGPLRLDIGRAPGDP